MGGDVQDGDTVTVTVNGVAYTGTVSSGAFSINVPGSGLLADGDLTVDASVTTTDGAGNSTTASDTQAYTVETTGPTVVSVTMGDSALKIGDTSTVTIVFSEAVTGFSNSDVSAPNGTLSDFTTSDNVTWMATFTPTADIEDAANAVTVAASYTDLAGNAGGTGSSANYAIDTLAPAAPVITTPIALDDVINAAERTATVTVSGTNEAGSTVTLNGNAVVANTATTWHYELSAAEIDAFNQGAETLTAVATDAAGNTATSTHDITVDTANPVVTSVALDASQITDADAGSIVTATITFLEAMNMTVDPVVTHNAGGSLTGGTGSWLDDTHYQITYTAADANVELADVTFDVSGAKDLAGNLQDPATGVSSGTAIDTLNPSSLFDITLDLDSSSDSAYIFDNITNVATPVIKVSSMNGIPMSVGDKIEIVDTSNGNVVVGSYTVVAADLMGGNWQTAFGGIDVTLSALAEGPHALKVRLSDQAGNTGTASNSTLTVTEDLTSPTVSSVAITSATGIQNSTLNEGDTVSVTVTMSEAVTVTGGPPQLALNIGGATVQASYASGSGTSQLVFTYTIQTGQTDANGIGIDANALSLNGGTIGDVAGNAAVLTAAAVADNAGFKVDTTAPAVSSVAITGATGIQNSTLNLGDVVSVTVTLDDAATVTGTPQLALNIGGTTVQANYASGSGGNQLVFTYTIQAGQTDADGISLDADALSLNGGTITDLAGNAAVLTTAAVAGNAGYLVDTTAPVAGTLSLDSYIDSGSVDGDFIGQDDTFALVLTGSSGGTATVYEVSTDGGSTWAATGTSQSALPDDDYGFRAVVTDDAGNSATSNVVTVVVDKTAPVANAISPSGNEDTAITVTLSATDTGGSGIYTYNIESLPSHGTLYIDAGLTNPAVAGTSYASNIFYFKPDPEYSGGASFDYTVTDIAGNNSTTAAVSITVNAANDAPVATITPVSYAATEQTSLALQGTGLSIGDADAGAGSMTVTLSVTEGTLTVAAGTTGAGVANSGTSAVTITGTVTQINDLLAGSGGATVSYIDNTDAPSASATLTLQVSDNGNTGGGALLASDTATINIAAVNDGPAAAITPPTYAATEQTSLVLKGTGLSIGDADAGAGSMTVILSVTEGTLTATAGNSGAAVSGSGTSSLSITGTVAQINSFLGAASTSTLSYINNSNTPSASATLTLEVSDNGNTGGGALLASDTATINIAAANDAPVGVADSLFINGPGGVSVTLQDAWLVANDTDPEGTTLNVNAATAGTNVTGMSVGATTLTFDYNGNSGTTGSFTYTANDGALSSGTTTVSITRGSNNAAITGNSGNNILIETRNDDNVTLDGGAGSDFITGGAGINTIIADDDDFLIDGGSGTDTLNVGASFTSTSNAQIVNIENVSLTAANLTLDLSNQTEGFAIAGSSGIDTIIGGSGADTIDGNAGADAMSGNDGNDIFVFNTGDVAGGETIDGGANTDTLRVNSSTDFANLSTATVLTAGSVEQILIASGQTATFTGAQLTGQAIAVNATTASAATLTINVASNGNVNFSALTFAAFGFNAFDSGTDVININSAAGSEIITGTSLADNFSSGTGSDDLSGGGGNDVFTFAAGTGLEANDVVSGGTGTDTIVLTGNTTVAATDFNGASSIEAITVANTTTNVNITTLNALVDAGATLTLNASSLTTFQLVFNGAAETDGAFNITGGGALDIITGGGGADTIDGNAGADAMSGNDGNDTFVYNTGDVAAFETIDGGAGTDTLRVNSSTDFANLFTATVRTAGSVEQILIASGSAATFTGAQLTGQLIAVNATAAGAATLTINVASGSTTNFSAMTFTAFGANNAFDSGTDVINIVGAAGAETITGTSLADNFSSGTGDDNLTGGLGNDVFTFAAGSLTSLDWVSGGIGTDTIALTGNTAVGATDFNGAGTSSIEAITIQNTTTNVAITTLNALVDAGVTLTLNAGSLTTGILTFNGAAEADGAFNITGGGAADIITGGALADTISGGAGNDTLSGGGGADSLTGGTGLDTMTGGRIKRYLRIRNRRHRHPFRHEFRHD